MKVRRVVAGTQNGKAVFLSDGLAPQTYEYKKVPGFATSLIWHTVASPTVPEAFDDPVQATSSLLPQPGETKCLAVSFPPDSIFQSSDFNPEEAHAEQQGHLLGLYECFDPERPGMHASPTIDYGIVVKGPLVLELDDGQIRELRAETSWCSKAISMLGETLAPNLRWLRSFLLGPIPSCKNT